MLKRFWVVSVGLTYMNLLTVGKRHTLLKKQWKEGIIAHTQVHDELNISIKDKKECEKVIEIMRDCVELKVPNKVDAEIGKSWGDVKDYEEYFNEKN